MNDQEIISDVMEMKRQSEDYKAKKRDIWREAWALYNNEYDFSEKEGWQSKNYVSKISVMVENTTATIKKMIISAGKWFTILAISADDKPKIFWLEGIVKFWLDKMKFPLVVADGVKTACLSSLFILKIYPKNVKVKGLDKEEREKTEIVAELIDPEKWYPDPTGKKRWVIHQSEIDLIDLLEMAEEDKEGGYIKEEILNIRDAFMDAGKKEVEAEREESVTLRPLSFETPVMIDEFWGDLIVIKKEKPKKLKNITCTIANGKYLIRRPTENKFWHKKSPFISAPLIRKPFSVWHKSVVEDSLGLQKMMTELLNLTLDGATYDAIRAFEIDMAQVFDPSEFKSGIYPGKVFKKKTGFTLPMIKQVETGALSPQILAVYRLLEREAEQSGLSNELKLGTTPEGNPPTATEVRIRIGEVNALLKSISENLEEGVLVETVRMIYKLALQYQDNFSEPSLKRILGDEAEILNNLTMEERYELASEDYDISVAGITEEINKIEELGKIMQFMNIVSKVPQIVEIVMPHIPKFLEKVIRNFGWNPDEFISEALPPTPALPAPGMPVGMPTGMPPRIPTEEVR